MPPEALEWHVEYLYRRAFALTHEEYLDEPGDAIEWLLRIHQMHEQLDAEAEARRARG